MSLKDFQFLNRLGQGSYSSVYKVRRLIDNEIYAIKKVRLPNLTEREKQNALNEIRILASISHPNIISYKEAFLQSSSNTLYIVMEYADEGDLYSRITTEIKNGTTIPEQQIWSILIQVTRGLRVIHEMKILHRDLKSANIFMFKNGQVKIGDMNVAKVTSKSNQDMCKTQTGTPYYASPEVWKDQQYDRKSDIWSLGCILYECICLKMPFKAHDMETLMKKIIRGFYNRIPDGYSDQLAVVLKMLLQVVPHLRPSCDKLLELPILMKHLPPSLEEKSKKTLKKNKLLQSLKMTIDTKDRVVVEMPRPRYLTKSENEPTIHLDNIDRLPQIYASQTLEERKPSQDVNLKLLPPINTKADKQSRSLSYQQSVVDSYRKKINTEEDIVKRLIQPIQHSKLFNDRRVPLIYQGRLRSISPSNLRKILDRQREKQKVHSIIDK